MSDAVIYGCRELLRGCDFVAGECNRHPPLRELNRKRRGDRQSIFGNVDQKKVAPPDVARTRADACEHPGRVLLGCRDIKTLREPVDGSPKFLEEPGGRVR